MDEESEERMLLMTSAERVQQIWECLHAMPEVGFEEVKTSAYLAEALQKAGYQVTTGLAGTGVVGVLDSGKPGPTLGLRADMDALAHEVDGTPCAIHSCGHDAHSAMVLAVAEEMAKTGLGKGRLKIIFQPAEEKLFGALRMIEAGAIDDVDYLLGIHLRHVQEAKLHQATPALYHGASYILEGVVTGAPAHGARPHLGVNAIDAAAAVVQAVNAIHVNPVVPATAKVTKFQAGGAALNAIPDKAIIAVDARAQQNDIMDELIGKIKRAVEGAAASVGAVGSINVSGGCPAAEYDPEMIALASEAIVATLGQEALLAPITTPGGEDFHYYVKHKPAMKVGYIGLGADLTPGLHHPAMRFDQAALTDGVNILLYAVNKLLA